MTAAVDNIDHNPSSSTATESFHGTGISIFQNRSSYEDGNARITNVDTNALRPSKKDELIELPPSYANVPIVVLKKNTEVPKSDGPSRGNSNSEVIKASFKEEMR